MKHLIFIVLAQVVMLHCFGQGNFDKYDINVEFIAEPAVTNGTGNIKLLYTSPTENNYTFKVLARSSRNNRGKDDQYAEVTYLRLTYITQGSSVVIAENLPLFFIADGLNQSPYKEFQISIPQTIQTDGQIVGEFYTRETANQSSPIVESKTIASTLNARVISGPTNVCSEGVFVMGGSDEASLVSADGIASLTSLGNNEWKLSRIGSASGVVTISRSIDGVYYFKSINVGESQFTETYMNGPSMAIWGQEHNITIIPPSGLTGSELEVGLENNLGRAQLIKVDKFNYKLRVHMQQSNPDLPPFGADFIIRARFTNACGNYEYRRFNIKAANSAFPPPGGIE